MSVSDGRGRAVRDAGLARWLACVAPPRARGDLGIALVSDAHIRKLNARYRRKQTATDVLSFASDDSLGDIVIATGVARRQARQARHSYAAELRVLALHGLLHLLGYDHERASDRRRMARLEARLRSKGGLKRGLIERAR